MFSQRGLRYSLVSGHGGQTKYQNGDEGDGYDEGASLHSYADFVVNS